MDLGRPNCTCLMGRLLLFITPYRLLTVRDIDLVVTKPFTESNKVRTLSDMARAMRQSKIADTVAIISKARVPIIKFVTNEGELSTFVSRRLELISRQTQCRYIAESSQWNCSWKNRQPISGYSTRSSTDDLGRKGILESEINERSLHGWIRELFSHMSRHLFLTGTFAEIALKRAKLRYRYIPNYGGMRSIQNRIWVRS